METPAKGTVTPVASLFPTEEARKAVKHVEFKIAELQNEMNRLNQFVSDNAILVNLVKKLPDKLHHDIMVPFGNAAFFPGRLIHTNEFLVFLGENHYVDRTSKQTVEILKRRGKSLKSQVHSLKAVMEDLEAEASFFSATASEAADGLVEIREEIIEEPSSERASESDIEKQRSISPSGGKNVNDEVEDEEFRRIMSKLNELEMEERENESDGERNDENKADTEEDESYNELDEEEVQSLKTSEQSRDQGTALKSALRSGVQTQGSTSLSGGKNVKFDVEDEEFARMMSRLDELEIEELENESDGESDEDNKADAEEDDSDNEADIGELQLLKPLEPSNYKATATEVNKDQYRKDHSDQLNCTGLMVPRSPKDEASNSSIFPKSIGTSRAIQMGSKISKITSESGTSISMANEMAAQKSKPEFDSSKAFTGSIVEHSYGLQPKTEGQSSVASQSTGSQRPKPVSRFKMQRRS